MSHTPMRPRLQRYLILALTVYFILIGGTFYTERSAILRSIHQVATALMLIGWLIVLLRRKDFPRTPLDKPLLVYGLVWLAAALFARDRRISLEYAWPILTQILGYYVIVDIMRRGRQRWIMEALFTTTAIVVILSAVELAAWYFGLPLSSSFVQAWPAIGEFTIPPVLHKLALAMNVSTMLGNFSATLVPITAAWAMTARQRDLRIGLWLLTGGITAVLFLSGSRGALMALATSTAVLILTWLLKDTVRLQFPKVVRPLLAPRVLISLSVLATVVFIGVVYWSTMRTTLRSGDENRLDLWESAVEMVQDHPVLGIGPFQYGAALRQYGDPEQALQQDRLVTAHNLPLNILAESGILGFTAGLWLAVTFGLTWLRAWQQAYPNHRRRLEGVLAAFAGFGIQSLVDTYTITPLIVPLLIMAAYTVSGNVTRAHVVTAGHETGYGRRVSTPILAVVVIAQLAFIPVHVGNLNFNRALNSMNNADLLTAVTALTDAQTADPTMNLYHLQEAYTLGLLASEDPDDYLQSAIAAHESGLSLDPTWDTGWHNLAALYAQAGRVENAIGAEETAIEWNPTEAGYHLKLGEYYEQAGHTDSAGLASSEAIRRNPRIASSGFWSDPAHPARLKYLADAVVFHADDKDFGLLIALEAGELETASAIASALDPDTATGAALNAYSTWVIRTDPERIDCQTCLFIEAIQASRGSAWLNYVFLAEAAIGTEGVIEPLGLTGEQAARMALFIAPQLAGRSWYVLAQMADLAGAEDASIDSMLVRAVPPRGAKQEFSSAAYGRAAALDILPQARTPFLSRTDYEPWLWLAERATANGDQELVRRIYEVLLEYDPYLWDIEQKLAELP